jgi:hypothetical protein
MVQLPLHILDEPTAQGQGETVIQRRQTRGRDVEGQDLKFQASARPRAMRQKKVEDCSSER